MSYEKPTRLRIGMHGKFAGKDYRLVGRVVMGVIDDGETYYWNEFNLEAADGTTADLVYEETERGGEWRLFTLFDPEYPITAADAATKRVGDHLNLTGTDVHVTLRDTSRVYRIEGKAPEGVEVGDVAHYFNAEAGNIMQVVSWTGDEVECYDGVNLARGAVMAAFNLPYSEGDRLGLGKTFTSLSGSGSNTDDNDSGAKLLLKGVLVLGILLIIFGRGYSCSTSYQSPPVKTILAGPSPFAVGASGRLKDKNYHVTGHAVAEMAEVGAKWERHEYQLTDDDGTIDLLVCGWKPGDKNWTLFASLAPLVPPTAKECAGKKVGDPVNVAGVVGPVSEIFLCNLRQIEGKPVDDTQNPSQYFGYLARSEYDSLFVRWNQNVIRFRCGTSIPVNTATAAFSSPPGK